MDQGSASCNVTVELPVTYQWSTNGADTVISDVRICGLSSIYEYLPPAVKLAISNQIAAKIRGI